MRCFEDTDITHVEGKIDPIADIETIETELMLADLDSLETRVDALEKKARGNDRRSGRALDLVQRCAEAAARGQAGPRGRAQAGRRKLFSMLGLMTAKPVLYVCNVEESAAATGNEYSAQGGSARQGRRCGRRS